MGPPTRGAGGALGVLGIVVLAFLATVPVQVGAHANHVEADPQVAADGRVVVETALTTTDGWIVLHADDDGTPGATIGHTAISDEGGIKTDVPVPIDEAVWRNWSGTRTVWVTLHRNAGGSEFDPPEDEQIVSFGDPVGTRITVRKARRSARVLVAGFAPQDTFDRNVSIRRVTLPSKGYLVVHNDTGETPGEIVGVTALAAGGHDNVGVTLEAEFFASRGSRLTLWAVVYTDDGDGTFDDSDRPVRAGDRPVGSEFGVQKRGEALNVPPEPPNPTATGTPDSTLPTPVSPTRSRSQADGTTTGTGSPTSAVGSPGFGGLAVVIAVVLALVIAATVQRNRY